MPQKTKKSLKNSEKIFDNTQKILYNIIVNKK